MPAKVLIARANRSMLLPTVLVCLFALHLPSCATAQTSAVAKAGARGVPGSSDQIV